MLETTFNVFQLSFYLIKIQEQNRPITIINILNIQNCNVLVINFRLNNFRSKSKIEIKMILLKTEANDENSIYLSLLANEVKKLLAIITDLNSSDV